MPTERNVHAEPASDAEIESDRQIYWKDRRKELKKDGQDPDSYRPGTLSAHEPFHLAWVLQDVVARDILEHPAILADEVWYRLARRAHDALFALYQEMGAGHLSALPGGRKDEPADGGAKKKMKKKTKKTKKAKKSA